MLEDSATESFIRPFVASAITVIRSLLTFAFTLGLPNTIHFPLIRSSKIVDTTVSVTSSFSLTFVQAIAAVSCAAAAVSALS